MAADVSQRLRCAIVSNDLTLVQRLLKIYPSYLQNPDFSDCSNTSLHLAAQHGLCEIAAFLIELGHGASREQHDRQGILYNSRGQLPLHLAAANLQTPMVELLCRWCPLGVNKSDNDGSTPLLLAAKAQSKKLTSPVARHTLRAAEETSTTEMLLEHGADVGAQDRHGNTCLHNACAWGNLRAVRLLIEAGADPHCSNYAGWTPGYYSLTVQAEVYYKNLVTEFESRKAEEIKLAKQRKAQGGGSVRLVPQDEESDQVYSDSSSQ